MKSKFIFIPVIIFLFFMFLSGYYYHYDKTGYSKWIITTEEKKPAQIYWTSFNWASDSLSGRYFKNTAMLIPCQITGIPQNLLFQFDLGSDKTQINDHGWTSLSKKFPQLKHSIGIFKSSFLFWNTKEFLHDITINFGSFKVSSTLCLVKKKIGDTQIVPANDSIPFMIGTIGSDLFKNKILIIDYPNHRFSICDTVPISLKTNFLPIDLDETGRMLLPMQIKNRAYKILFDNGSSLFPLLIAKDKMNELSTLPDIDSFQINSWGNKHTVVGRRLNETFILAGKKYAKIMIYADSRTVIKTTLFDGITGNALFWDKILILDFKNKRFGSIP